MKFRAFIEDNFLIDSAETGQMVPFVFRPVQAKYYEALCNDYSEQDNFKGLREVICKARKEGFTSMILSLFMADIITNENPVRYLEISYKDDATKQHYRRAKQFVMSYFRKKSGIEDDKQLEKVIFKSITEGSEFVLAHNGASFYVGTASVRTGERGGTVQGCLFSEAAHYASTGIINASEIIESTRNMVAVSSGMVFLESTSNGRNHYYKLWQQAKRGEVDYKPRFFSWRDFYTEEQFEKIKAGFTDKRLIPQEYPDNDEESFLTSGQLYFDPLALQFYLANVQEPITQKIHDHPAIKQYRPINARESLIIAADGAAGGNDWCAAQVFSRTNNDIPITYHSKTIATEMTNVLHQLLEKLSDTTGIKPIYALERNFGGAFELDRMLHMNRLEKYEMFVMPSMGMTDPAQGTRYGFDTNSATRPAMLINLKDMIDNKLIKIYDKDTVDELFSFVVVNTNTSWRAQSEGSGNDDLTMSLAIALQISQLNPAVADSYEEPMVFPDDTGWVNAIGNPRY